MYKLKSPIYFLLAFSISFNLIAQSNNLGKKISQKQSKNATNEKLLHEDAWDNDPGFNFEQKVDFIIFTLEVKVSKGEMVIILNGTEYKVYKGIHMER